MNPKLILVALLVPAGAFSEVPARGQGDVFYQAVTTDQAPPADEAGRSHAAQDPNLEAQLDAARKRLDEAARQVAELTNELGGPLVQRFSTFQGGFGRAIIGVQLDVAGGKDGARVIGVSPGGPAAEAGMRAGDVIVAVNGTDVKGEDAPRQVVKVIREVKADSKVNIRVLRDGKTRDFTVTARPGPAFMGFEGGRFPEMPPMPGVKPFFMARGPLSEMELASLTPQLGKYFGTEKGVLVVRAPQDGALKLEDGDVILAIDGREPTSGSHATRILGSYQPGEKVSLRIVRQHKNMDLETTVPDEPPQGRRRDIFFRAPMVPSPMPPEPGEHGAPGKVVITHHEAQTT
jgi:predicted metalloprotease with PDZ domain